jgi:hypothetical protein
VLGRVGEGSSCGEVIILVHLARKAFKADSWCMSSTITTEDQLSVIQRWICMV